MIALPPLIFLGCAVVGGLLQFIFPIRVMRYSVSLSLGVALAVASATLAIWAARVMKAAGTNVRPDRPALTIVRSGPYRFTRNPKGRGERGEGQVFTFAVFGLNSTGRRSLSTPGISPTGSRPRGRVFTFDVSHLTRIFPGITTAKFCEARTVAGIKR